MTQVTNNTGFQSLLKQRAAMQNWSQLANLLNQGRNREAAAIVNSFQLQMESEESERSLLAA